MQKVSEVQTSKQTDSLSKIIIKSCLYIINWLYLGIKIKLISPNLRAAGGIIEAALASGRMCSWRAAHSAMAGLLGPRILARTSVKLSLPT